MNICLEAELIILKKKIEEEEKRKTFEQERRRQEAETLKKASEMKRKRDKEDAQLQKELQLKRLRQEEAKRRLIEEKRIQEELQRKKDEEEIKNLEKLEAYRRIIADKEQIKSREVSLKREMFNKQKEDFILNRSGRNSSNSMVSSPIIFEGQKVMSTNSNNNVTELMHKESPKSEPKNLPNEINESISKRVKDVIIFEEVPQLPPPPIPPPPIPSPPLDEEVVEEPANLVRWESHPSLNQDIDEKENNEEGDLNTVPEKHSNEILVTEEYSYNNAQETKELTIEEKVDVNEVITIDIKSDDGHKTPVQDINANFLSPNNSQQTPKSAFGLGWRDVKTGLVKNRSSNYQNKNKSQISNYGKNVINKSSSWLRRRGSKSKSKSPEPVLVSFTNKSDNKQEKTNEPFTNDDHISVEHNEAKSPTITAFQEQDTNEIVTLSAVAPWRKSSGNANRSLNNSPSLNLLSIEGRNLRNLF